MARYENTRIRSGRIKRGVTRPFTYNITSKTTTIYEPIPKMDSDIYVITQMGDRLDHLAHQFYSDVSLWWYIAKANNLIVMKVPTGTSLRIPENTNFLVG